ncbi:MAG TPA: Type 1 glutamine amidotransferase-like domain-containing protein [Anaerolineales bacterium]|nr:Type 1 glutamine amidotransferase-like domain-containing protein [Anaerolineales bacterium]
MQPSPVRAQPHATTPRWKMCKNQIMYRKLAFYSDQQTERSSKLDEHLLSLIGKQRPIIGYIPSSTDAERTWYKQQQAYYKSLDADLSVYFELEIEYEPDKAKNLFTCDAIHLSGGSTYNFLYWLRKRGLISLLHDYVANGGVLIGVSAGAILMTPEISTTHICGEEPSHNLTDLSALNFVDFAFLPHINRIEDVENKLIEYSITQSGKIFGCPDGDGIIVNGNGIQCVGDLILAENGKLKSVVN